MPPCRLQVVAHRMASLCQPVLARAVGVVSVVARLWLVRRAGGRGWAGHAGLQSRPRLPSRARLLRSAVGVVDELAVNRVGDPPLEAAQRFRLGLELRRAVRGRSRRQSYSRVQSTRVLSVGTKVPATPLCRRIRRRGLRLADFRSSSPRRSSIRSGGFTASPKSVAHKPAPLCRRHQVPGHKDVVEPIADSARVERPGTWTGVEAGRGVAGNQRPLRVK
jgi:hypothetical protein